MEIQVTFNSAKEMEEFCRRMVFADRASQTVNQGVTATQSQVPVSASATFIPVSAAATVPAQAPTQAEATMPASTVPSGAPGTVPTASTTYTLDELARAAIALVDSGKQVDLQQLLAQFGVEALPVLPKEQYGAFATALRGMGAQI